MIKNKIGQKYGHITIIYKIESKNNRTRWLCRCDCGNEKVIFDQSLTSGKTKSCGCLQYRNRGKAPNWINLSGKKFGKLTVINEAPTKNKQARWFCRCDCGNEKVIIGSKLRRGETKSCGCLRHLPYCWKGYEEINGTFWNLLKSGAKKRKISFNITIETIWEKFIQQNRKCAISGVPLSFAKSYNKNRLDQTASLDRINSNLDYTIDNIQWVHRDINLMKNILSQDKFINWCKIITINTLN